MSRAESVWGRLQAAGLRRTSQREVVLETLAESSGALPLPVVLDRARRRAPGLGERTVERTLALLVSHGAVDAFTGAAGAQVYRLCGDGHHHHLVCSGCGAVAEIADCDVSRWAQDQAARHGFAVEGHDVTVYGRCAACADAQRPARG